MSSDVVGDNGKTKRQLVWEELRAINGDVVMIQDTRCLGVEMADKWRTEWGGLTFFTTRNSAAGGVGIMFRKGLQPNLTTIDVDP